HRVETVFSTTVALDRASPLSQRRQNECAMGNRFVSGNGDCTSERLAWCDRECRHNLNVETEFRCPMDSITEDASEISRAPPWPFVTPFRSPLHRRCESNVSTLPMIVQMFR